MKDWVNRQCLLSGVIIAFLLPCTAEITAAEMSMHLEEEAQYSEAHKLLAQIRKEGTVILNESGEVLGNSIIISLDIETPRKRVEKNVEERSRVEKILATEAIKEEAHKPLTKDQEKMEAEKLSARIFSLLQEKKKSAPGSSLVTEVEENSGKKEETKQISHSFFRPVRLDAVPIEFFVHYAYRPDLPVFTQLRKLLAIEQHVRNFHKDKKAFLNPDGQSVYQRNFTPKTIARMQHKLLNRYMIYQLHLYSAILHRQMESESESIPTEPWTEEEWRSQSTSGVDESDPKTEQKKLAKVWGMGVEIHIRRAQYALWALQALSEMTFHLTPGGMGLPYNLSTFGITRTEVKELLDTSGKELFLASIAFATECQEGKRLSTDQQFMEILTPYIDARTRFLTFRWRIETKEIQAE